MLNYIQLSTCTLFFINTNSPSFLFSTLMRPKSKILRMDLKILMKSSSIWRSVINKSLSKMKDWEHSKLKKSWNLSTFTRKIVLKNLEQIFHKLSFNKSMKSKRYYLHKILAWIANTKDINPRQRKMVVSLLSVSVNYSNILTNLEN